MAFTDQVIANLGRNSAMKSRTYKKLELTAWPKLTAHMEPSTRELVGIDVFLETDHTAPSPSPASPSVASPSIRLRAGKPSWWTISPRASC